MNCLNEAIGLALPGNGTVLATHQLRWSLFERAGERIVEMAQAYYRGKDSSMLPRSIATFEAFENAMSLDIAMGGSTNTVLHLLAMAREAGVDFTMADIDRLSRQVPCICKVAPASQEFHVEDVARAGGIPTILGELQRAGLVHAGARTVRRRHHGRPARHRGSARRQPLRGGEQAGPGRPGRVRTKEAFFQANYHEAADLDDRQGCIRSVEYAYSRDGGLAVLFGNLSEDGCILKTAGVDESILTFEGPARIFESQEAACEAILGDCVQAGAIGLLEEGDVIRIDTPNRRIEALVPAAELEERRARMEALGAVAWQPLKRRRRVSAALQAYAALTTSAAQGAVRDVSQVQPAAAGD